MNAVTATQDQMPVTTNGQAAQAQLMPASPAEAHYQLMRRKAVDYSKSSLVPKDYQGNPANVIIAMEIAQRIGASDLMVMQNLYIVHGRPSWSATFLIASVNSSKRFTPLRFEVVGTDPSKTDYRVRAYAEDLKTGQRCDGAWITWAMVTGEKWGPKWKTMPEQMFMYRAASFWTRTYAPEVSMGIHTREEVEDIIGEVPAAAVQRADLRTLEHRLLGQDPPSDADMEPLHRDDIPPFSHETVSAMLTEASNIDELNEAGDLIRDLPIGEARDALGELYAKRSAELSE